VVSCARVDGLEPRAYLLHLFEELPKANTAEALDALLRWNLKSALKTPPLRCTTISTAHAIGAKVNESGVRREREISLRKFERESASGALIVICLKASQRVLI
jgi:hypothetical protein